MNDTEELQRYQFRHYINIDDAYELEGKGTESLEISMNPQIDTYKTIISTVAENNFQGYQMQASVSGKRAFKNDNVYNYLRKLYKEAKSDRTKFLEVDTAYGTEGKYEATEYEALVVVENHLGENVTISYTLYLSNPVQGTAVITNGKPVFTKSVA